MKCMQCHILFPIYIRHHLNCFIVIVFLYVRTQESCPCLFINYIAQSLFYLSHILLHLLFCFLSYGYHHYILIIQIFRLRADAVNCGEAKYSAAHRPSFSVAPAREPDTSVTLRRKSSPAIKTPETESSGPVKSGRVSALGMFKFSFRYSVKYQQKSLELMGNYSKIH